MKSKILILLVLIVCSTSLVAQSGSKRNRPDIDFEKLKAEKVAYITTALLLTPEEAQVFWPVYNEMETKKTEIFKERKKMESTMRQGTKKLSEEDYAEFTRKMASLHFEDGKIMTEYNEKFLEILSAEKVYNLHVAEINFRKDLLHKWKEHGKQ